MMINNLKLPGLITGLSILLSFSCIHKPEKQPGFTYDNSFQQISDSLHSWTNSHTPVGVEALIIKNEKVLYHKAFGFKDLESNVPLEINSIFRVASMTKPITATGILILKERGKLQLNDKISKYIPAFKKIAEDSITIEHLLRHTSGYGEFQIWKDYGEELRKLNNIQEVVDILAAREPVYPLGFEEYSSLNTILLSRIIEVSSGMPAEFFLKENILQPLKMNDTYLLEDPQADWFKKIPKTYGVKNGIPEVYWIPGSDPSMYPFFRGATGAATTAHDYAKFLQLWLNKGELNGTRILQETTVDLALDNKGKAIGLHWFVPQSPIKADLFGHAGWYGTSASGYQNDNAIVVYLTQTYNAPKIAEFYEVLAYSGILEHPGPFDIQKELPKLPNQPNDATLRKYIGKYRAITLDSIHWSAVIDNQEGHLQAHISSDLDSWSERLVNLKPDIFAPGYINKSTPFAISPQVFYEFQEPGSFKIRVFDRTEFNFIKLVD
ncbi:serine hydrolase domain-containing protein [Salegentibacter sediminis]|uniref:serine hydrolase domain-containing protein n=1 Tax=Salegentibacter sediminis TaxID=1930251 RepID=UPI0009C0BEBD|nr:serine hydrolase domain-containing protein [Salegentibacter sediminis]